MDEVALLKLITKAKESIGKQNLTQSDFDFFIQLVQQNNTSVFQALSKTENDKLLDFISSNRLKQMGTTNKKDQKRKLKKQQKQQKYTTKIKLAQDLKQNKQQQMFPICEQVAHQQQQEKQQQPAKSFNISQVLFALGDFVNPSEEKINFVLDFLKSISNIMFNDNQFDKLVQFSNQISVLSQQQQSVQNQALVLQKSLKKYVAFIFKTFKTTFKKVFKAKNSTLLQLKTTFDPQEFPEDHFLSIFDSEQISKENKTQKGQMESMQFQAKRQEQMQNDEHMLYSNFRALPLVAPLHYPSFISLLKSGILMQSNSEQVHLSSKQVEFISYSYRKILQQLVEQAIRNRTQSQVQSFTLNKQNVIQQSANEKDINEASSLTPITSPITIAEMKDQADKIKTSLMSKVQQFFISCKPLNIQAFEYYQQSQLEQNHIQSWQNKPTNERHQWEIRVVTEKIAENLLWNPRLEQTSHKKLMQKIHATRECIDYFDEIKKQAYEKGLNECSLITETQKKSIFTSSFAAQLQKFDSSSKLNHSNQKLHQISDLHQTKQSDKCQQRLESLFD